MTTPNVAHRLPAPARKRQPAFNRAHRPAPLTRRDAPAASKSSRTTSASQATSDSLEEDFEVMAGSFIQFCTSCDKQMIVPNSSVLFCSESCRRKDSTHSTSYPLFKTDVVPSSPQADSSTAGFSPRDIVPQRSPTISTQSRMFISSDLSDSESESVEEEALAGDHTGQMRESEAANYLRKFQSAATQARSTARRARDVRPRYSRASTTALSTTPSLSHTPASYASTAMSFTTQSSRPLPPRHHSHSYSSKSVDLVTPITNFSTAPFSLDQLTASLKSPAGPILSPGIEDCDLEYGKRQNISISPGQSSLRQLLQPEERT